MKKLFILAISFLAFGIGTVSAQGWGPRNAPDQVKIEGTLQLDKGQFAVASGNNIYYVPKIGRYVGFIDNLKEGSNVSFEGYVSGNFLRPLKMTIDGKSYDLTAGDARGRRNGDFDNRNDRGFNRSGPGFGPYCCGPDFRGNRPRDNFKGRR